MWYDVFFMSGHGVTLLFMGQFCDDETVQNPPVGVASCCPCVLARAGGGKNWDRKVIRIMLTIVSLFTHGC